MNASWMLACFFCGVDSRALLIFALVFVFSLVLAGVCFMLWAVGKGEFKHVEDAKYAIFNDPEAGQSDAVVAPPMTGSPSQS